MQAKVRQQIEEISHEQRDKAEAAEADAAEAGRELAESSQRFEETVAAMQASALVQPFPRPRAVPPPSQDAAEAGWIACPPHWLQAELAHATSLAAAADTGALERLRGELAEAEAARSMAEAAREAAAAETIDVEAVSSCLVPAARAAAPVVAVTLSRRFACVCLGTVTT